MTGALGWRRLRTGNAMFFPPESGLGGPRKDFGKQPDLFDYWIEPKREIDDWEDVVVSRAPCKP
jgi:hypothetical protein